MILKPKDVLTEIKKERNGSQNIAVIFFLNDQKEIVSIHRRVFFEKTQLKISDIFIPAFYLSAKFVVLVHIKNRDNNQNILPTPFEIELTQKIVEAGKFLDIQLLDHVIVTKNQYYSFHESKII